MSRLQRRLPGLFLLSVFLFPGASSGATGEVTLPLKQYLDLTQRIEALERSGSVEPPLAVAEWVSQETLILLEDDLAKITTRLELTVFGSPEQALTLPMTGFVGSARLTPTTGAALHREPGGPLLLVPERPGTYHLELEGAQRLRRRGGRLSLDLAKSPSPVAITRIDLARELAWECAGAVVVEDLESGGRRRLRLALDPQRNHRFEVWRQVEGEKTEETLVQTVVATLVDLGPRGAQRLDLILYEVLRGEMDHFEVELPEGLDVELLATDEGEALPQMSGRTLRVHRQQRLRGVGYLALASQPPDASRVPVASLQPEVPERARYLLFSSSIAAEAEPWPAAAWTQVDVEDLPAPLRDRLGSLRPSAVWRQQPSEESSPRAESELRLSPLPPVAASEALIAKRETTTLLTIDGSLVHRDEMEVRGSGGVLEVALPEGAVFWAATVDGQSVRPVLRDGAVALALPMAPGTESTVEVISVEERALPVGRSRLEISLARVALPVLEHRWRLLLPEDARYRFVSGELSPAEPDSGSRPTIAGPGGSLSTGSILRPGSENTARLGGRVVVEDGTELPGATVILSSIHLAEPLSLVTNERGAFQFTRLLDGAYDLEANLDGFNSARMSVRLKRGDDLQAELRLSLATVTEEMVISLTAALPTARTYQDYLTEVDVDQVQFRKERRNLMQGTVGGVRPLPVTVPETGKLLYLSGALPPERVTVTLDVRARPSSGRSR